jgi:DNA-binding MarR family transcriptional regulator
VRSKSGARVPSEVAARLRLAIARTARRLRQEAGGELSPSQAAALASIERHGPLTPSELAALERVKRPTATRVLSLLADAGLIRRAPDPTDRRSALLSVSDEGRALLRRMRTRKDAYLARRLEELTPAEVATLERSAELLERLLEEERG